jgi:hypothetical protein
MTTIPEDVRAEITAILWKEADRLEWSSLGSGEKSRYYTMWTETERIGGRLAGVHGPSPSASLHQGYVA